MLGKIQYPRPPISKETADMFPMFRPGSKWVIVAEEDGIIALKHARRNAFTLKWVKKDLILKNPNLIEIDNQSIVHRGNDKPAIIVFESNLKLWIWLINGHVHREGNSPAMIMQKNYTTCWHYHDGKLDESEGPAVYDVSTPHGKNPDVNVFTHVPLKDKRSPKYYIRGTELTKDRFKTFVNIQKTNPDIDRSDLDILSSIIHSN